MTHPLDALFPSNDRIARDPSRPDAPSAPLDMVTVARRFNPLEAELLRGRLAADGIPATLGDSHTVLTDPLLTPALGGVRVRVPAAYERQALRAIADMDDGAFTLDETSGDACFEGEGEGEDGAAAVASTRGTGVSRGAMAAVAVILFFAVLVGFLR